MNRCGWIWLTGSDLLTPELGYMLAKLPWPYHSFFVLFILFVKYCYCYLIKTLLLLFVRLHAYVLSHSHVWLLTTLWTVARQAPLSMRFSRQEYWSGLPFPPPGDLLDPGFELASPASPGLAGRFFTLSHLGSPFVRIIECKSECGQKWKHGSLVMLMIAPLY